MANNDAAGEFTPEVSQDEYIASLKKALEEEKARAEANLAGWQRAQADYLNFKKFVEQEKQETRNFLMASIITDFLPVLDDLDRAIAATPEGESRKKWLEGFKLIHKKFQDILEKQGLKPVKALGEEFDCRCMDAMACIPGKKDLVIQEFEKGYTLNDKVIRPAKVLVGSGEEAVKEEDTNV